MYLEEEDTPKIVEIGDDGLDFVSDIEGQPTLIWTCRPTVSNQPRAAAVPRQKGLRQMEGEECHS